MHIGFDLDGTIIDSASWFREVCKKFEGMYYVEEDWYKPETFDGIHYKENQIDQLEQLYQEDYLLNVKPFEHAIKLMAEAKYLGHIVSIVTGRGGLDEYENYVEDRVSTFKWLISHNVPFDNLIFSGNAKGVFCCANSIDLMFEDYPEYLDNIIKMSPKTRILVKQHDGNKLYAEQKHLDSFSDWRDVKVGQLAAYVAR